MKATRYGMVVGATILSYALAGSCFAANGALAGSVIDQTSNKPVEGAKVDVSGPAQGTATTQADGSFTIADLPPGTYDVSVEANGQQTSEPQVTVEDGQTAQATLQLAAPQGAKSAVEQIVVMAQRTSSQLARKAQEEAPNLINIRTADEIQKLPDQNTGEAIRRIPGISLETDEGEGRYVNIRGFDADLDNTTFAGVHLLPTNNASPFGGYRALALDSIPTGFIGAITLTKTNLPSQQAQALGGTIDILPKAAPPGEESFLDGHVGTGYEPLRGTYIRDYSLTAGGTHGPWSAVVTLSHHTDGRGIDDAEPAYFNDSAHPYYAFSNLQQRDYELYRRRHGYALDVSYEPDPDNKWYLRGFEAGYTERYYRWFLNLSPDGNTTVNANGSYSDTLNNPGALQDAFRDEEETSTLRLIMAGGQNTFGQSVLSYHVAAVTGTWYKPYDYNSSFNYNPPAGANATITYDQSGPNGMPAYTIAGAPGYLDAASYTLNSFANSSAVNFDKETSYTVNLKTPVSWAGAQDESLTVGSDTGLRHKRTQSQPYSYATLPALSLTNASSGGSETYYDGLYQNPPDITPGYLQGLLGPGAPAQGDLVAAAQQYLDAFENVYAGYFEYRATFGKLGIVAGARDELTRDRANIFDAGVDASKNPFILPRSTSSGYSNLFPSLQTRYELDDNTVLRAVYSSTIARPGFNQQNPALSVDLGSLLVTTGNPNLKPATAHNVDLSYENYLEAGGILSFGIFDKQISNYIVPVQTNQVLVNPILFHLDQTALKTFTFQNASSSYARGVEMNWVQHFRKLPGAWAGLGAGFNITYVKSSFDIRPGETSSLPSTSQVTWNASVSYDYQGLSLNLAEYYVAADLFGIGGDPSSDVYNSSRRSMDFGASYTFTDNWTGYFGARNLLNTPHEFYQGASNRPIQRETYGITYTAGVRFKF